MKIVCDSCGAKYSIADEKVRGKVFKIRCKKCSDVIVVKGDSGEESASGETEDDAGYEGGYGGAGGASEWYAVIEGDQAGPITPDEVEAYYKEGVLEAGSYVWREGLDDWSRLDEVDEFAHLTDEMAGPEDKTVVADPSAGQFDEPEVASDDKTVVTDTDGFGSAGQEGDDAPRSAWEEATSGDSPSVEVDDEYGDEAGVQASGEAQSGGVQAGQEAAGGDDLESGFAEAGMGGGGQADDFAAQGGFDSGGGDELQSGASEIAGAESPDSGGGVEAGSTEAGGVDSGGGMESGGGFDTGGGLEAGGALGGTSSTGGNEMAASGGSDSGGGSSFESFSGGESGQGAVSGGETGGAGTSETGGGGGGGPRVSSSDDRVGQRSENSVLFSLSSVDEMKAVDGPDEQQQAEGAGATTEGSGLIDIQNLAASHAAMSSEGAEGEQEGGAAPAAGGAAPQGGAQQIGQDAAANVPSLAPSGSRGNNTALIVAVVVGFVFLSLAIVAAVYIMMQDSETKKIVKKTKQAPASAKAGESGSATAGAAAAGSEKKGDDEKKEGEKKAEKGDEKKGDEKDDGESSDQEGEESSDEETASSDDDEEREVAHHDDDDDHGGGGGRAADDEPDRTGSSEPSSGGGGGGGGGSDDSLDNLVEGVGGGSGGGGGGGSSTEDLPTKPSRGDVKSTIGKYAGRIQNCGGSGGPSGTCKVWFRIQPSGRVSSASIKSSSFKGTQAGNCVKGIVQQMKFPKTQKGMPVVFPFTVQ